jgi:acyl carrier protein
VVESFGIDSVALVELRNRVNRKFGVWLPANFIGCFFLLLNGSFLIMK